MNRERGLSACQVIVLECSGALFSGMVPFFFYFMVMNMLVLLFAFFRVMLFIFLA